jgi:HK97 gp10 family phage protein
MSTLTPEEFSKRIGTLVRTGAMGDVLLRVATAASIYMDDRAQHHTTGGNPLNVRTGKLRLSIKHTVKGNQLGATATVMAGGGRAHYAVLHERGIGGMPKRPFLKPSRDSASKRVPHDMISEVNAAFRTVNLG